MQYLRPTSGEFCDLLPEFINRRWRSLWQILPTHAKILHASSFGGWCFVLGRTWVVNVFEYFEIFGDRFKEEAAGEMGACFVRCVRDKLAIFLTIAF